MSASTESTQALTLVIQDGKIVSWVVTQSLDPWVEVGLVPPSETIEENLKDLGQLLQTIPFKELVLTL